MGITSTAMARNHFGQWQQKAHNIIFIHQQRTAIYQHYIVLRNTNKGQRTPQTKKHKRTNERMNDQEKGYYEMFKIPENLTIRK